mmetsp:Transcript_12651/g.27372  ORF Transcript_12651/g.27372 Transcript_12651/m.27372 type:complete len:433 (+) Transcript_12651:156-1454(+)
MAASDQKVSVGDKVKEGLSSLLKPVKALSTKIAGKDKEEFDEGLHKSPFRGGHSRTGSVLQEGNEDGVSPTHIAMGSAGSIDGQMAGLRFAGPDATATVADGTARTRAFPEHRKNKFTKLLSEPVVDIDALRELCWNGIPPDLRPTCWRLLLGYLPPAKARQATTLARKRLEYQEMVPQFYDVANSERTEEELAALRQVIVDVPRTAPTVPFFQEKLIQKSLERLLYIWGIRHPASGYVQGMNDLVTPFLAVFLGEHLPEPMESWTAEQLSEEMMLQVEADCYWCLCKLVEAIQDHYTYAQPGIQRTVFQIKEAVHTIKERLVGRLDEHGIDFIQFAWRWVNCLLIREVPFELSFRLWDTYLAEGHRFAEFLTYACAAFLMHWEEVLMGQHMEFQDIIMFLQKPPTQEWREEQLEMVLTQAYVLRNQLGKES